MQKDRSKVIQSSKLDVLSSSTKPHSILGMHPCKLGKREGLVVRAYLNDAQSCYVVDVSKPKGKSYSLKRLTEDGFFEGFISRKLKFDYRFRVQSYNGKVRELYDPYSFLTSISEEDIYLFNEGNLHRAYNVMGAQIRTLDDVDGVSFAVWAPNAKRVSLVGDFNNWDGRYHPMRSLGNSGIWELFMPGLKAGVKYKFEINATEHDYPFLKADPYGTCFEPPPHNASIVCNVDSSYQWNDAGWINQRELTDWLAAPISIYEMHVGSWKRIVKDGNRPLSYRELASELVGYLRAMHYTHVQFMPLSEHPFDGSWGYQVTGFFAPTHRFGSPEDFMYLVDTLHQNGFGVIMDWVPGHFATDNFALEQFDGTALYEHQDPRKGFHKEWGTYAFNYGRNEVCTFLTASALAWCDRYHIDGFRVDAVASMLYLDYSREEGQWLPNKYGGRENLEAIEFLRKTNSLVHRYYPGTLMIAEESTAFPELTKTENKGGVGFDLKWNMGWMHDTLNYFQTDPIHRKHEHNKLTFGMLYQYTEQFTQVFSHDEVVHGKGSLLTKMYGSQITDKARQLRLLFAFMWMWPGKKTLFMGSDFGQSAEWDHQNGLDWPLLQYKDHEGVQKLVRDMNLLYQDIPGIAANDHYPRGFEWINHTYADESILAFLRKGGARSDTLVAVGNYTSVLREEFRIGVPYGGYWKEVINTDAKEYGGDGDGNHGGICADELEWDNRSHSICLTVPSLSMCIFQLQSQYSNGTTNTKFNTL